jgi:hypothetical protein
MVGQVVVVNLKNGGNKIGIVCGETLVSNGVVELFASSEKKIECGCEFNRVKIPMSDILQLVFHSAILVPPNAKKKAFIDSSITLNQKSKTEERILTPFFNTVPVKRDDTLSVVGSEINWDQFAVNEDMFGLKSNYNSNLYSQIPSWVTSEDIRVASDMADEIVRDKKNFRNRLQKGNSNDENEENMFSAVQQSISLRTPPKILARKPKQEVVPHQLVENQNSSPELEGVSYCSPSPSITFTDQLAKSSLVLIPASSTSNDGKAETTPFNTKKIARRSSQKQQQQQEQQNEKENQRDGNNGVVMEGGVIKDGDEKNEKKENEEKEKENEKKENEKKENEKKKNEKKENEKKEDQGKGNWKTRNANRKEKEKGKKERNKEQNLKIKNVSQLPSIESKSTDLFPSLDSLSKSQEFIISSSPSSSSFSSSSSSSSSSDVNSVKKHLSYSDVLQKKGESSGGSDMVVDEGGK